MQQSKGSLRVRHKIVNNMTNNKPLQYRDSGFNKIQTQEIVASYYGGLISLPWDPQHWLCNKDNVQP